jgi:transposase
VRATTLFNRLLDLPGTSVSEVTFAPGVVSVTVSLRRRRLLCPLCDYWTPAVYDTRPAPSSWRHLDMGKWKLVIRASLRRLNCPAHGVLVEQVPFARHRSGLTCDFEDLVAYLATKTDKTAITRILRIDWDTVGRACERVVADGLDPCRLDGLVSIGVDAVSWRKHHRYLTLVTDHAAGKIVWGAEGKDTATLDAFFDDLGSERAAALQAVSMDMGPAFAKSVTAPGHAPQAVICIDPFHAVKLAGNALDVLRRQTWNELRQLPDQAAARKFKGARWSLMKKPENVTDEQSATLRRLRNHGGDLDPADTGELLDRSISKASRSGLAPFVKVAKTIRKHRDGILAAIRLKINNARAEGLNNHVRLITRRAYGFHSPTAALALVMLSCGPIQLRLPHETTPR